MGGGFSQRKTVFISYAHADAFHFVPRLAFALSMYADVFWDRHLETGPFPDQLYREIETRDCFILVLSPFALRENGWCRREYEHALKHNKSGIALAQFASSLAQSDFETHLIQTYNCGDFTEDFEIGFRLLTQIVAGDSYSSWEYLAQVEDDRYVMKYLEAGFIPGLIAKSLAEWAIVDYLWPRVEDFLRETEDRTGMRIWSGTPRTLRGVNRQCQNIIQQFAQNRNSLGVTVVKAVALMASEFIGTPPIRDSDHQQACELAVRVVQGVRKQLEDQSLWRRQFATLAEQRAFFDFNVAEKLRELVTQYARRSRYLY